MSMCKLCSCIDTAFTDQMATEQVETTMYPPALKRNVELSFTQKQCNHKWKPTVYEGLYSKQKK